MATRNSLTEQEVLTRVFDENTNTLKTSEGASGGSAIGSGRKTIAAAGTAEALASSTTCKSVVITAETDNTGVIAVGDSGVIAALATRKGTPLNAGDSIAIDIDNLSKIYLDTTVNGDGVTYTYTA